jgi:hypothetical protein
MNGRATSIDKQFDTPTEKIFRVQASLTENLNLRNYPFDKHALRIIIEDKDLTVEELRYRPDPSTSGVDNAVIIAG